MVKSKLSSKEFATLLSVLQNRFEKNKMRHNNIKWENVKAKLEASSDKSAALNAMETSGGEPDVIAWDKKTDTYLFVDCSEESPKGRRSLCYDLKAFNDRKENKPTGSAMQVAEEMGVSLLTEEEYRQLQTLGEFDLKTSSWIVTNEKVRKLGGALFCDRRYDTIFTYHNGASSYYAARGFRAKLLV